MSNSSTLTVTGETTLSSGTYVYDGVLIEPSGVLTLEGNITLTTETFTLQDGGQISINGNTTINTTTFIKDIA